MRPDSKVDEYIFYLTLGLIATIIMILLCMVAFFIVKFFGVIV